jgi:hypothetical protein
MSPTRTGRRFDGTIAQDNGESDVSGWLVIRDDTWFGNYHGAASRCEPMGGDATLTLADGQRLPIVITRVFHGSGTGEFTGSGDPPRHRG